MTTATIQILDPRPEQKTEERAAADRLPSLSGKTIGLVENRKYHSDNFLQELQVILEEEYAVEKVVYLRKFTFSAPCSDETIEELIEQCDAVVHGIAD
ncbi:MAG: hypothetical protein OXF79_05550 [Chloroflexi bacterium]|nr:hypothetical protein [Chloroflexota bacterium]